MWDKIKKKLSSRKLWLSIIGFITALLIALNTPDDSITKITAVISAFGTLVAYIVAEGYADGNNKGDK